MQPFDPCRTCIFQQVSIPAFSWKAVEGRQSTKVANTYSFVPLKEIISLSTLNIGFSVEIKKIFLITCSYLALRGLYYVLPSCHAQVWIEVKFELLSCEDEALGNDAVTVFLESNYTLPLKALLEILDP